MSLYFTFALCLIVWYGGWEIIRGDLTAGDLAKFVLYLNQLTFPIQGLGPDYQQLLPGHIFGPSHLRRAGRQFPCGRETRRAGHGPGQRPRPV